MKHQCVHSDTGLCMTCMNYESQLATCQKELADLRSYCTLTFGESHPEIRKCVHEEENKRLKSVEQDWLKHDCGVLMTENSSLQRRIVELERALQKIHNDAEELSVKELCSITFEALSSSPSKPLEAIKKAGDAINNIIEKYDAYYESAKEALETLKKEGLI